MSAVQDSLLYTLDPTNTSSLNYDDPILFNYDYVADTTGVITRNSATGEFTIRKAGNYLINWWVVVQTSTSSNGVGFGIKGRLLSSTKVDAYRAATNSLKTGEFSGSSIISLTDAKVPYVIQLVNITGYSSGDHNTMVVLGLYSTAQAGITISELGNGSIIGPVGPQGITGETGPQGLQGQQGLTGNDGVQGLVGSTGVNGADGAVGPVGARGPQGIAGPRGALGPQGPIGQRGLQGDVGPQGAQGNQGSDGAQGEQGPMGPQGSVGPAGSQGAQGDQGSDGIQGEQGPMGPQGAIGQQGYTGQNGAPNKISGINYSMTNKNKLIIPYKNSLIFTESNVNFVMDSTGFSGISSINVQANGDINLLEPGLYDFEWYVCIEGIDQVVEIAFDIIPVLNGIPDYTTSLIHCAYPVVIIGQVNAQGLIPIISPTTVRIINSSTASGKGTGIMSLTSTLDVPGAIKIVAYTSGIQ